MEKSTKLIVAAIGLGGLGYFLYKRGLFSDKTSEVKMPLGLEVEDVIVDTGKKTAVEPPEKEIVVDTKYFEEELFPPTTPPNVTLVYGKLGTVNPFGYGNLGFRDNTYFDQPTRIDYNTGKYNQDVVYNYGEIDMVNSRYNQLLYS